jgi:hypothetical protein
VFIERHSQQGTSIKIIDAAADHDASDRHRLMLPAAATIYARPERNPAGETGYRDGHFWGPVKRSLAGARRAVSCLDGRAR